jgi:hypothetical protein
MFKRKENFQYSRLCRPLLFCVAAALAVALMPVSAKAQRKYHNKSQFCSQLGKTMQASSGAQMYCFGPQLNGAGASSTNGAATSIGLANVDAANTAEDRGGSGLYAYGQSETSIAASGNYVVEAWNDATSFFNTCGAPMYKEEGTGYGFSRDGGKTFTDLGGLPNINCGMFNRWVGDPSVGTYSSSGSTYFYISAMYACDSTSGCPNQNSGVAIALSACKVTGTTPTLKCGQPTVVATGNCASAPNCFPFLDKDYLTVDQSRKRVYISYTDFTGRCNSDLSFCTSIDEIDLAACELDNPMAPICSNGTSNSRPYVTVQPTDTLNFCEYEGAYPALRKSTGAVYVAYEYNWATNVFGSPAGPNCIFSVPTEVIVAGVPLTCLPDPDSSTPLSHCQPPFRHNSNFIVSMAAAFIPGYNRFPMNDYPRIAVSEPYHAVSLVWNDARHKPLGDTLLQSYELGTLTAIQASPVRLNSDANSEGMHILPGLRNASSDGLINVTWYDRRGNNAGTTKTDVFGALNVNPRTSSTPSSNLRITNQSTDWLAVSSDIVPNFGDYTENYVSSSNTLFVAWSDGRNGAPQPYEAHVGVH